MRKKQRVQTSIFDHYVKHEIGNELKHISMILDEHTLDTLVLVSLPARYCAAPLLPLAAWLSAVFPVHWPFYAPVRYLLSEQ